MFEIMSAEIDKPVSLDTNQPKRLSVKDTLVAKQKDAEGTGVYLPIGGVSFNEGKSFLALGSDMLGKVVVGRVELQEPVNPDQLEEGSERLLDLSDFKDVAVIQTGFTEMDVRAHRSIRTSPSMGIRLNVENRETEQTGPHLIGEEKILNLFTGEAGGIAVFSGYDLPEDNALVFEKGSDEDKNAEILFVRPSGNEAAIGDSVEGLYLLIGKLNEEFQDRAPMPLQTKALKELENVEQYGEVDFHGSDVRAEIYKAHVIALARQAEKTHDPKYKWQLKAELPMLEAGAIQKMFGTRTPPVPGTADAAIDGLIKSKITAEKPTVGFEDELNLTPKDTSIYQGLDLEWSKDIWREFASERYYRSDNEQSRDFVNTITSRMYHAKTRAEFDDVGKLIDALFASGYQNVVTKYEIRLQEDEGFVQFYEKYGKEKATSYMKNDLLKKHAELQILALGE